MSTQFLENDPLPTPHLLFSAESWIFLNEDCKKILPLSFFLRLRLAEFWQQLIHLEAFSRGQAEDGGTFILKGQCHQIRMALKWGSFKVLS